jgi:hypothetical protein
MKVVLTFIADGSAMNLDFGFIPDHVRAFRKFEETNPDVIEWWKRLADDADNGQYGILLTGSTGVVTVNASAAAGIAEYDESLSDKVAIPAPSGEGEVTVTVADYSAATDYSVSGQARSTSQAGTVVRPTTHNGMVYECTVAGGAGGTEPTWPTTPGETVSDDNNTWICREEKVTRGGGKGITIGASLSTDSDEWLVEAESILKSTAGGDSAAADPVKM